MTFSFPDPKNDPDHSNQRVVEIHRNVTTEMKMKVTYESRNFAKLANAYNFRVLYRLPSDFHSMEMRCIIVSHGILVEVLTLLKDNWIEFLTEYLQYDLNGFHEFILSDVLSTVGARTLDRSDNKVQKLREILRNKGYSDVNFPADSNYNMLSSIFTNFRGELELGRSKREIISALKESRIVSARETFSESLNLCSCEVLAAALTYVPVEEMREAVSKTFEDGKLGSGDNFSEALDDFIITTGEDLSDE